MENQTPRELADFIRRFGGEGCTVYDGAGILADECNVPKKTVLKWLERGNFPAHRSYQIGRIAELRNIKFTDVEIEFWSTPEKRKIPA